MTVGTRKAFVVQLDDRLFLAGGLEATTCLGHARIYRTEKGAYKARRVSNQRIKRPGSVVLPVEITVTLLEPS